MAARLLRLIRERPSLETWLEPLTRPGSLLILAANLLPLLGAIWLGWEISTLVVLYWLETAVIGIWVLIRLSATSPDLLARTLESAGTSGRTGKKPSRTSGLALGLFVLAHAGVFMFVHFMFLSALLSGPWEKHLSSPADFLFGFVIASGIWLPLAGLFLVRGILTVSDIRQGISPAPFVAGFYVRILVMQGTILLGGFLAIIVGGTIMLALLVMLKTLVDLYAETLATSLIAKSRKASRLRS